PGKVAGMKFERTELTGDGNVRGTGEIIDYPVQAVYRAIGYFGSPLHDLEFDHARGTIPNVAGRVLDADGAPIPGLYTTGWIKRGPVGLIGHTKGDALETIGCVLADLPATEGRPSRDEDLEVLLRARGVEYTTWEGWLALDAHERILGENAVSVVDGQQVVRERIKVVPREEMVHLSGQIGLPHAT
ncbi:pyridine nucleotide-disulfide oxidoreductase, partial [Arthrobacter sp. NamB2]